MSKPNRIYLQLLDEDGEPSCWPTWCEDRVRDTDIEYVPAERLRPLEVVAEAVKATTRIRLDSAGGRGVSFAQYVAKYDRLLSGPLRTELEAIAALEAHDE